MEPKASDPKMKPDHELVLISRGKYYAEIILNRPHKLNAINIPMSTRIWKELPTMQDYKVVFLKGNGKFFSAGGDVQQLVVVKMKEGIEAGE